MGNISQVQDTTIDLACRRRAERIQLPIEVQLMSCGRMVNAVIRDASFEDESPAQSVGICIFHNEELPLDETLNCRVVSVSERIPVESQVRLIWTRVFGNDGYLSGGTMLPTIGVGSYEANKT